MPLKSGLFQGDAALEACLVHDMKHVTPGAVGRHVARIQRALLLLDNTPIDLAELHLQKYGTTTARAVLAYKQKRRIINRAYQTSADNIVGKMTIASLDNELFQIDRSATGKTNGCRTGRVQAPTFQEAG